MDNQSDMFSDSFSPNILDNVNQAMEGEESKVWPSIVVDLFKIVKLEYQHHGIDDVKAPLTTTLALIDYLGGMQVYVPKGERLRKHIRNMEIYYRFNGRNIRELSRQYEQTEQNIYRIIAEQKRLHIKRKQPDLFG
ncbi:MAG: Mor transcription activator family protein [Vibrio sp.]